MTINFPKIEEKILKFWQRNKIFEKSISQRKGKSFFSFYDGPPFATGLPHHGHILASTVKDVVPRYWTMKGYYVPRRWGWDCHGLPIENIIEEKLKISGKKEIEKIGIDVFNKTCRENVLTYVKEWGKMVERIGRFVDFENSYKTMDNDYIESVWWAIREIWKKGLIYEGRKVLLYCSRCESPISNFEVAMDNSYQDITEESVIVKFKIKSNILNLKSETYFLVWTTTPWTLPGNMALAVAKDLNYLLVKQNKELYILAASRKKILQEKFQVVKKYKGKDLIGIEYEPLYEIKEQKLENKNHYHLFSADFVSSEEGTGIVHIAPVYGEDDYKMGVEFNLPIIPLLDNKGKFNQKAPKFIQEKGFKESELLIKDDLKKRKLIYKIEKTTHSYPFCWRCNTALFYNAIPAWFINIQKIKKELIQANKDINWHPSHLKYGRFQKGIESAPDWTISRNRYWASPLPIWKCDKCKQQICIGSIKELKEKQIGSAELRDLHRPYIDEIKLRCSCSGEMKRILEVIDCWVESASMPFAEIHYPFKNKDKFKKRFPADFIAEYIPQTRAWFYVMHVISVILFNKPAFKNAVTTGTILNEKGEKMSKSKKNFPDTWKIIKEYGADSLRFYLISSSVTKGEDLFFSEKELKEVYQKNILLPLNMLSFYKDYQLLKGQNNSIRPKHILDKWILSRLNYLIKETTQKMDNYDIVLTAKEIKNFISDLSLWYLRRSRERFKRGDKQGTNIFRYVLFQLSIIIAPFTPFLADHIYQTIKGKKKSVHLENWPKVNKKLIDEKLNQKMEKVREVVTLVLAERAKAGIKVRQPLNKLQITNYYKLQKEKELQELIKEEVNVKEITFGKKLKLDTKITSQLKEEGIIREAIRQIQDMRKEKGLKPKDKIIINYFGDSELNKILEKNKEFILIETKAKDFCLGDELRSSSPFANARVNKEPIGQEKIINQQKFWLAIKNA
jgi:isoleucyl-tRNA synthetase